MQNGFRPWIRSLEGIVWWKKPRVKNLVTLSLLSLQVRTKQILSLCIQLYVSDIVLFLRKGICCMVGIFSWHPDDLPWLYIQYLSISMYLTWHCFVLKQKEWYEYFLATSFPVSMYVTLYCSKGKEYMWYEYFPDHPMINDTPSQYQAYHRLYANDISQCMVDNRWYYYSYGSIHAG
jgi:hypothetical protein